jgi:arginine-tRNA-protein transferase
LSFLRDIPLSALQFYLTEPYPCSYLPAREARSQVATPSGLITARNYAELVKFGFRRSGGHIYRPRCDGCQQCVAVRVEVENFAADRSQRRTWKRHQALTVSIHPLAEREGHFDLYQRYQAQRHAEGGMDQDGFEQFRNFLLHSKVDSMLVEFHEHDVLRMVSVIDKLDDGLSAVYTFFEPNLAQSSFGVFNVLWQIELCRKLNLPFLYLGYWIADSQKMSYKTNYQPLQGLQNNNWQLLK